MRKITSFFFGMMLLLSPSVATAQNPHGEIHIDLPAMYQQIDELIEQSPHFIADYEKKLQEKKDQLDQVQSAEQRMMLLLEISNMYESFNGDSTQAYTERTLQVAQEGGFKEIEGVCMARLAYLCTFLASQTEALTILGRMNPDSLNREALVSYYRAYMMAYSNLSTNTRLAKMREEFGKLYQQNMDSLLSVAPEGSEMHYRHMEPQLIGEGKYEEALRMNDKRLDMTQEGTHDNAIICYSRYSIYRAMGEMDLAKYWLCKSAIDDVRNAVMDQMSLIALAELVEAEGDNERATRHISFTWDCNRRYSPHLRSWQIAPLLSAIEQNYQTKIDRKGLFLTIWTVVVSAMLVFFIIGLYFVNRQRRQLRATREELEKSNKELAQTNQKLEWMNRRVTKHNKELMDINKSLSN